MAINQHQMVQALRTKLDTLSVVTTPATSLACSGKNFVRTSGSFVTDLYFPGMELVGSGLGESANEAVAVVKQVTALELTVNRTLTTESAGAGKSISVGLPSLQSWENIEFDPSTDSPWVEENFLPGPASQVTIGPGGDIENDPMYVIKVHIPSDVGSEAVHLYGDALVSLFAPRTAMALTNGDTLRVRTNPGPFRGQLLNLQSGWATVSVTIPLRIRTVNP